MVETTRPAGLDIERPETMPTFEEFENTAKKHLMSLTGLSQAEVDEFYAGEDAQEEVKKTYEAFLSEVQKNPKDLRNFGRWIGMLNSFFLLDIERPETMPTFEEFESTAKKHLMSLTGLSQAEVDEFYAGEYAQKEVKPRYEAFLSEVQENPKRLRCFGGWIGTFNSSFWLDIERPKTMPTFEEFERTAKNHYMVYDRLWLGYSIAAIDKFFAKEDVKNDVKVEYERLLKDVEKDPKNLRYYGARVVTLCGLLDLIYPPLELNEEKKKKRKKKKRTKIQGDRK